MNDLYAMRAVLSAHQDFAECVVKAIHWSDFHTVVAITFDYIWMPDGTVRPDSSDRRYVTLVFRFVREFTLTNDLRPVHLEDPEQIGWGLNELSNVTVHREPGAERPRFSVEFYRARLNFEHRPWVEIVFAQLDVLLPEELTSKDARAPVSDESPNQ